MTTPKLAFHVKGKGRHYRHPSNGEVVPSITNIIDVLSKPAIPRWAAKQVAEAAWKMRGSLDALGESEAVDVLKGSPWRSSSRAADRGTSVHDYLEAAADGDSLPTLTGDAALYRAAADSWLDGYLPEFHRVEFTVFGDGYAGTADFLADLDGRLVVGDYKTSKRLYPEIALQLAAIRHADMIVGPDGMSEPMPEVDGAIGVLLTPSGVEVREVDAGIEAYTAFQGCLEAWTWRHGKGQVGKKLEATR